ncbi:MAG: single-stranded-DNA-specific exonuclease RecJ, partial [Candidatus Gastranaerophilales bacterium]|nr:single-stranded-DNA-specific exonuclease RecJ [Candidatus Gastranaerophilales bacterium]
MVKKEWEISDTKSTKPLIERLLSVRGIKTKAEIKEFLNPLEFTLTHPNAFCDMQKAVDRIEKAVKQKEKILIYGDFDADGITSTSLLLKTLEYLDADVDYYIPERELDGHGLNTNAIIKLMVSVKPKLIITVDCGISNIEEVAFINSFKKDVIITDHHEAGETLPDAYAVINPKAQNSLDDSLSAKEIKYLSALAGVGVAFKLAQGVLERFDKLDFSTSLLPYVAVGTIADIVPLIGENRYYVIKGLDLISKGKHYGLKRLLETAGYNDVESGITSEQIAFGAAPRINACGRLGKVQDALKVLISTNKQEIELAVIALDNYNKIRQELSNKIFEEADAMASKSRDNMLVLYKKDWHIGIIGIVASKLVEKYGKPTFLMTYSEETGQVRCSARGVEGCEELSLYDIISDISEKLDGYGGHALAAGLYFSPDKTSFEDVKSSLLKSYNNLMNSQIPVPILNIDLELSAEDVTEDLIKDVARLEPFGASNPSPAFVINGFKLVQKKLMGSNKEHLRLTVEKDGIKFNAIWWSYGDIALKPDDTLDIAFTPQLNSFNGNTGIQLIIKDVHSDCFAEINEAKVITYDNRKKTDIIKKVSDYLAGTKYEFCVFAEIHSIVDELKQYPEIFKRIVNRQSLNPADGIMFFDYPPAEEIMQSVIQKVSPVRIHYMNYNLNKVKDFDYLKTFSGMIKYVCNSKEGKFDLNSSACFLGITNNMAEVLLELFEDGGCIHIDERAEDYFLISYLRPCNPETLKGLENYNVFNNLLSETINLRRHYMECDLSELEYKLY